MRILTILFAFVLCAPAFQAKKPLTLKNPIADKNFYFVSRMPAVSNSALDAIGQSRAAAVRSAVAQCGFAIDCLAKPFRWTDEEQRAVSQALVSLEASNPVFRRWIEGELQASGTYVRYQQLPAPERIEKAWLDCARGINHAIDVYALGQPGRSAAIDSMLYDPKSESWKRLVQGAATLISEDQSAGFSEPSLRFAVEMMEFNQRDEAARHEPMEETENKGAVARIPSIDWSRYAYSAIVVPGSGNDRPGVRLSAFGKLRNDIAASRYRKGGAPFIIVSGGYVHPNRTEYAEAIEMRRDLIDRLAIPASAIIVDPHARHTTTNLRNAARLIYRYGIPFDKPALVSSDAGQSAYIENEVFKKRCLAELGYLPYQIVKRTTPFDLEFLPKLDSLQIDPADPLDP